MNGKGKEKAMCLSCRYHIRGGLILILILNHVSVGVLHSVPLIVRCQRSTSVSLNTLISNFKYFMSDEHRANKFMFLKLEA